MMATKLAELKKQRAEEAARKNGFARESMELNKKLSEIKKNEENARVSLNKTEKEIDEFIENERRNWKNWTDSELIKRFENGDFDYSQVTTSNNTIAKKLATAYATCKPGLDTPTPGTIVKIAKAVVSVNTGGPGGFWVMSFVERPSKLLSEEEVPAPKEKPGTPAAEQKREDTPKSTVETIKGLSDPLFDGGRKRSPSTAPLNGEVTQAALENGTAMPGEKKQRLE